MLLQLFEVGDVACDRVKQTRLRLGMRCPEQVPVGAVRAAVPVLERHGRYALCQLLDLADRRLDVVGMDELDERSGEQLFGPPAQCALEGGVDPLEVAVGPRDAEHVERHIEELLEVVQQRHLPLQLLGRLVERLSQEPDLVLSFRLRPRA